MNPVLSILIPTYNRVQCLEECLESLAADPAISDGDEVEVMISDNCSTDGTESVGRRFAEAYPGKFVYIRQERNIGPSDNFTYLIKHGHGKFLKFQQDKNAAEPGAVTHILEIVKRHADEHPVLYFGNEYMMHLPTGAYEIRTHDELADRVSYWTTWIGGYGLWRDEADFILPIQDRFAASQLQQVAVIWSLFEKNRRAYLYNFKQYHACHARLAVDGGYNVAEVFSKNYLGILKLFMHDGGLSRRAFELEKKRLYFGHIYGMYFDFERYFRFKKTGFLRYTKDYRNNAYYWASLLALPLFTLVGRMPPSWRGRFFDLIRRLRGTIVRH